MRGERVEVGYGRGSGFTTLTACNLRSAVGLTIPCGFFFHSFSQSSSDGTVRVRAEHAVRALAGQLWN